MAQPGLTEVLSDLREVVEVILDAGGTHLCTIEEPTLVDDGRAGKRQEWAAAGAALTDIPCVAYPNAAQAKVIGEVPKSKTVYSILVRGGTEVSSGMRVKLQAGTVEPERTVEIKSVLPFFGVVVEIVGLVQI